MTPLKFTLDHAEMDEILCKENIRSLENGSTVGSKLSQYWIDAVRATCDEADSLAVIESLALSGALMHAKFSSAELVKAIETVQSGKHGKCLS
jgi:hypothetical protein